MSEVRTWKCSGCGTVKQETNRWWLVKLSHRLAPDDDYWEFIVTRWVESEVEWAKYHCCGMACVTKALDMYMQAVILDESE